MTLFPEPAYRTGRRLFVVAVILSLVIHLVGGGLWGFFVRSVVAKSSTQALDVPEAVAFADAITIEHRTVPHEAQRARSPRAAQALPPSEASAPAVRPLVMPTLPELSTAPPVVPAKPRAAPVQRAVVHRQIVERPTPFPPAEPNRSAFSPQQMAALDAQFSRTIAAQRALSEGPQQRGAASDVRPQREFPSADRRRYDQIMAGTPEEVRSKLFVAGDGECVPLQGPMRIGRLHGYYIRCVVHYTDGFFEQVSFPWPFYFGPHKDPFDYRDNPNYTMVFPAQDPPTGFALPANFALSRAVCAFFRPQCAAIIDAEIDRREPSYGKPP